MELKKKGVDTPIGNATLLLSNESKNKFSFNDEGTNISGLFDKESPYSNEYANSDLYNVFQRATNTISPTPGMDKITPRNLTGGSENYGDVGYDSDKVKGIDVTGQKLWPLSAKEAEDLPLQQRIFVYWWSLRSPADGDGAANVEPSGIISSHDTLGSYNALRPALYLNLSSSIFQSLNTEDPNWISNYVDYSVAGYVGDTPDDVLASSIAITGGDSINSKGGTLQLSATVSPANAEQKVSWSVNNENVATVNSTGLVTAKGDGSIKVYAAATDGSGVKGDVVITITGQTVKSEKPKVISISNATVKVITDKVYSGKAIKPVLTVKLNGKTLKVGTDYTVSYKNNKNIGKATITIAGKGMYKGTKTAHFNIVPGKTSISKVKVGKKQIKVTWKKVSKAQKITKYQIRYKAKSAKKWTTKEVSAKSGSITIKKLKKGKTYQVQVRSYKTVARVKYYSAWSKVKTSKKVR
jgi:hypothetical protein